MDINFSEDLFLDHFKPLLKDTSRYILLWGGRDSGKSYFAAQKYIIDCLRLPYFRCILVKKTYESIKDSQWQLIKDIVSQWKLDHLFSFNKSPLEIECVNGNKFIARGCDKPEKLQSISDPSHIWYEEGNQLKFEDFITITSTIRSKKATYLQEILSFNPEFLGELKDFWIYKLFFSNNQNKNFQSNITIAIDGEEKVLPYVSNHSTYKNNIHCTDQRKIILENLKDINPYYYKVYTLGEFGVKEIETPYITSFQEEKHINEIAKFDSTKQIIISFDFNVDNTVALLSHIGNDYIYFFDELKADNLPDLLSKIQFKYHKWLINCKITGDRSGSNRTHLISDNMNSYRLIKNTLRLTSNNFKIINNPNHKENRLTCNTILAFHPNLFFHPICKSTIFDIKYVECNHEQQIIKKDRNVSNQKADFLDCFRYTLNTFKRKWVKNYEHQYI